jgi:hypothetical protein
LIPYGESVQTIRKCDSDIANSRDTTAGLVLSPHISRI